jgi:hypothetical protein
MVYLSRRKMPLVYYNRHWRLCKSLYSPDDWYCFLGDREVAGGTYFTKYDGADGAAPSRTLFHGHLGRADARLSCGGVSISTDTNGGEGSRRPTGRGGAPFLAQNTQKKVKKTPSADCNLSIQYYIIKHARSQVCA